MDIYNKLFKLLKEHKWNEFINEINSNDDIDVNIRDDSNMYLIQYAILYNKKDIIKVLLSKDAKIDYIDSDGKTILYHPIKLKYNDIIYDLLEYNQQKIGISIVDIQDRNKNIPFHYAIIANNIDAVDSLIKYNTNFNIKDNEGNTSLHIAIKMKNIDIINKIINQIKKTPTINLQNNIGETPLHIACNYELFDVIKLLLDNGSNVDIKDYNNQITPLMYSIILNNNIIAEYLINYDANVNIQDVSGNTSIHYSIIENNYIIYNKMIDKYIDYNLTNIYGKTIGHLILETAKNDPNILSKYNFDKVLNKINVNIQDNTGTSILHILCKFDYWTIYKEILLKKRLNIYILNFENKTPFDYAKNKDELYSLVTKSYINILRNEKNKNKEWHSDIDKMCNNIVKYNDTRIQNNQEILNFLDKKITDKNDICYDLIKKYIIENKISIPAKTTDIRFNISKNNTNIVTYTGAAIDILIGLIYLHQNHIICSSLTPNFITNDKLNEYYNESGIIQNYNIEYTNFEIIWVYQKLFYPTNLFDNINNKKCNTFLIIPIGIEQANGSHSNMLIYDYNKNEMERFEPNGSDYPYNFNYNPNLLDDLLEDKFSQIFTGLKYFRPKDYLPKIGFQLLESNEHIKNKKIGDPGGFCAAWSNWWANMRISYNNVPRDKLVKKLIKRVKNINVSFRNLIRNYSKNITDIRDELFNDINIDINDWLNDNYNNQQINTFNNKLINIIEKI